MMPFAETSVERAITSDPVWIAGCSWGVPRPGHPEGSALAHLYEVLANIDLFALNAPDREQLRFVGLIHDNFKYRVDRSQARVGENHHAMIARRFAENYTDDVALLDVIELHDEGFKSWLKGNRGGKWDAAEMRGRELIRRLGDSLDFYVRFFKADNATGDKEIESFLWFEELARSV